ncbi:MAG: DUF4126 domain-containing protein, partial [Gemmatimonadetes bacterium]|nr:DUF4126 domain-containing protein [Gemmatimonadota bacterium]
VTKGGAALLRAKAGIATAGIANPVVSTAETVGALGLAVFVIAVPLVGLMAVAALLAWAMYRIARLLFRRSRAGRADS